MTSISDFLPTPDPRTEDLFLMSSVYGILIVIAAYLLIIYKIVPALMKNRPAFELKEILIAYNVSQVVINTVLFIMSIPQWQNVNLFCGPLDRSYEPEAIHLSRLAYSYLALKLFDLVETVFFVLRKKYNQVSFLHVYHHATMVLGVWIDVRYYPGGQFMYIGVLNGIVHIVMYSYYLLSIWDPKYRTSLWWKKYLTQLQISHQVFLICIMSGPLFIKDCPVPKIACAAFVMNCFAIVWMFSKFYYKNYLFNQKVSTKRKNN